MRDANNSNTAYDVLSSIKYRFGAKTFVNFLLEEKERNSETDVTHYAFTNPLNLTKNALEVLMDDLTATDSGDHVGLVSYGTYAVLDYPIPCDASDPSCADPIDLLTNTTEVENMYRHRQPAHYANCTNIGEGVEFATNCLNTNYSGSGSSYWSTPDFSLCQPRIETQKVIVLLTDGIANIEAAPSYSYNISSAKAYARTAAEDAWDSIHARIYAIGVGSGADMGLMDDVAERGQTEEGYWANGDFEEIQEELEGIFRKLGGRRPVQLIE